MGNKTKVNTTRQRTQPKQDEIEILILRGNGEFLCSASIDNKISETKLIKSVQGVCNYAEHLKEKYNKTYILIPVLNDAGRFYDEYRQARIGRQTECSDSKEE